MGRSRSNMVELICNEDKTALEEADARELILNATYV